MKMPLRQLKLKILGKPNVTKNKRESERNLSRNASKK